MNPYKGAAFKDAVTLFVGKLIVGLGEGMLRDAVAAELVPIMEAAHDRGKETQIREGLPHYLFNEAYKKHSHENGWEVYFMSGVEKPRIRRFGTRFKSDEELAQYILENAKEDQILRAAVRTCCGF